MGSITGEASAEIAAPIAEVWKVVEDVGSAPEWQDGLEDMDVLERDDDGRAALVISENDASVRKIRTTLRFSYDEPREVAWEQEEGDLKSLHGSWRLEEIGSDQTRATYSLEVDPGRMLGMLIRGPVESQLRKMLVNARPQELKAQVEGA